MVSPTAQRLALSIIDYLNKSVDDGTVSGEDREGIEIATNCIGEAFNVDPATAAGASPALLDLFNSSSSDSSSKSKSLSDAGANRSPPAKEPSEAKKKASEELKNDGNRAFKENDFAEALRCYSVALALCPGDAFLLSNRAAAHLKVAEGKAKAMDEKVLANDHIESAKADAEAAVEVKPTFARGWSRLGLAKSLLGDYAGAVKAYTSGLDLEGKGVEENPASVFDELRKRLEVAKRNADGLGGGSSPSGTTNRGPVVGDAPGANISGAGMPDLGSLASMLGGGGGGAGAGGAPGGGGLDFASIMSNPMFQSMAQNFMSNPDMMQNLMANPRLREMANQFSSGGGMPDLGSMLSDPSIAEMARSMMGGGGAPGGTPPGDAGRGTGGGAPPPAP